MSVGEGSLSNLDHFRGAIAGVFCPVPQTFVLRKAAPNPHRSACCQGLRRHGRGTASNLRRIKLIIPQSIYRFNKRLLEHFYPRPSAGALSLHNSPGSLATFAAIPPAALRLYLAERLRPTNNLDVASKKNPKQGTRLGVWSLLPHLGFWGLGGGGRVLMPPGLA